MVVGVSEFVSEMESLWTTKLGNNSNDGFRVIWSRMAQAYLDAIKENMVWHPLKIVSEPHWLVIAPEMGVGKTVGALLYLGMMARHARTLPFPLKIGGVFVCRTIKQCEEAVAQINSHAGYEAAITRHSENNVTLKDIRRHPILVITQAALLATVSETRLALVESHYRWDGGGRCLTIIDEALANAVEFHGVTEQSLFKALSLIPPPVREKHPLAWEIIDDLLGRIREIAKETRETYGMWDKIDDFDRGFDKLPKLFDRLLYDVSRTKQTERRQGWNDSDQRKADLSELKATLKSIVVLFRHWTMFTVKGAEPGMMSARLQLPRLWCPVLLNATANQDVLLDHIGAKIVPMPKVRNYQNLTIKVLRSNGIGKEAMISRAKDRVPRLCEFIRSETKEGDQWLLVTHKGTEDLARLNLADEIGMTAHWGALDGLNDFRECNKAVLFGLSYTDPTWSQALYFALRGKQPNTWFKSAEAKHVKHELESKALAAQVLQALGRPRSRRVSDEEGNCLPTTVYLTLPDRKLGWAIEEHIRNELPGVVIEPWDYQLDGLAANEPTKPTSLASAVVTHMRNRPPGKYTVSEIAVDLGLSNEQKNALKDGLKKKRKVYHDLTALGVAYVVEGERKAAKSYLVKRQ